MSWSIILLQLECDRERRKRSRKLEAVLRRILLNPSKSFQLFHKMHETRAREIVTPANIDLDDSVEGEIRYLAKSREHETEKPYYLYFNYDTDIARTNTKADDRIVKIYNARNLKEPSSTMFSERGFVQLHFDCNLLPEEYSNPEKVKDTLYPKYISTVRSLCPNAARIEILEHTVRKRDPHWLSDGRERHDLPTNQPSDYVHIDMTASSAAKCSVKMFDIHPREYKRFMVVNLWKPIRGPVYDFPLTLCDRRTVDYSAQTTAMDVVSRNFVNENTRIYHHDDHKWYYWHGLQVNELIAFIQADSEAKDRAGVPHTAFRDTRDSHSNQLRESIEARAFVYFDQVT